MYTWLHCLVHSKRYWLCWLLVVVQIIGYRNITYAVGIACDRPFCTVPYSIGHARYRIVSVTVLFLH